MLCCALLPLIATSHPCDQLRKPMTLLATPSTMIDARGARFSAAVTTLVLAAALVIESPILLLLQGAVFAIGAFLGPQHTPYARFFRAFVAPRLTTTAQPEPMEPPRFAQAVGLAFAIVGLIGAIVAPALFLIATAFALAAAFLNAAFSFCLGCQLYLILARVRG